MGAAEAQRMKLSLRETMGAVNERALMEAQRLLHEQAAPERALADVRRAVALPGFHGNLLAVRLTDVAKVQSAEVPVELEPARQLLLRALRIEVADLEPIYRERLANSHK